MTEHAQCPRQRYRKTLTDISFMPTYLSCRHTASISTCWLITLSSLFNFGLLLLFVQRLARQLNEDGLDPSSKWGQHRKDSDTEDPDSEDYMSIPHAGPCPVPGKAPARDSLRNWSDDDDVDCQILEIYDPLPSAFTYPLHPTSTDTDDQVVEIPPLAVGGRGGGKKRAAAGISNPPKRRKAAAKPRQRPMSAG